LLTARHMLHSCHAVNTFCINPILDVSTAYAALRSPCMFPATTIYVHAAARRLRCHHLEYSCTVMHVCLQLSCQLWQCIQHTGQTHLCTFRAPELLLQLPAFAVAESQVTHVKHPCCHRTSGDGHSRISVVRCRQQQA
jgi:hypothetical protein